MELFVSFSFQGQTDLNGSKPSDMRSAIEEAFLAESGFNEMLMVEINAAAGNLEYIQSLARGVFEASDSNQDPEFNSLKMVNSIYIKDFHLKIDIFSVCIFCLENFLQKNTDDII